MRTLKGQDHRVGLGKNHRGGQGKPHRHSATFSVTPAKAGIQRSTPEPTHWIPACAGMTGVSNARVDRAIITLAD